jgi:hypothetical protein
LLEQALTTARSQHARSLELRAAKDLASLWIGQGRRKEALAFLAPIQAWFTEGFDTQDLKEAKVLLDQLDSWAIASWWWEAFRNTVPTGRRGSSIEATVTDTIAACANRIFR